MHEMFVASDKLKLTKSDHIVGEHIVNMMKLIEKGYVNKEILGKVIIEAENSKNFKPFTPWLRSISEISKLNHTSEIIKYCNDYVTRKQTYSLERVLERLSGNYCRERALEAIGREIDVTKNITDESIQFIHQHLKYFLTKKNKKNFAYFLQSQASKPAVLKKLSQQITTYSVQHGIVPNQDILKDIEINEQITKLIQDKGLNTIKPQNVFYAEYGKLIELGYKAINNQPTESKIKEHFNFLKNFLELNQDHLPVGLCLTRLNDFTKATFRTGFTDLARDMFTYIIKKNNKEVYEDALFFYLWTYLDKNDFKETLIQARKLDLLHDKYKIQDPRLKFWIAFSYEQQKESKDAIRIYEDIILNSPLSYYAIMSVKKLQVLKPDSLVVGFYNRRAVHTPAQLSFDVNSLDEDFISSLIRMKAWARIDSQRMMKLELKRLSRHSIPDFVVKQPTVKQQEIKSDLHIITARLIQESDNYLASFRYLYTVVESKEVQFNRSLLEVLYPRPYLNELIVTLKKEKVDPIVVLSLIRQESVFNPQARSPVGARGLMQLMPATAKRMQKSVKETQLVNPKLNIELGTKYFNGLMKRYDGNLVYVLSAYNAGESRVERWKNIYFDTDATILKNIEVIPFLETRNYVKLIFRNIFFYKLLMEKPENADPSEPNKIYDVMLGFKH
jgi:soluble lytic murein transglycosylase